MTKLNKVNIVEVLKNKIDYENGFSVSLKMTKPVKGYMVGYNQNEKKFKGKPSLLELKKWFDSIDKNSLQSNAFLGGWYDVKNDETYLEISLNINSLGLAIKTAKIFNQLAVWDVENASEITIK